MTNPMQCECCGSDDQGLGVYDTEDDDAVLLCDECVLMLRSIEADK